MSPRLPSCSSKDVVRALLKLGYVEDRQRGSHKVFAHPATNRTIVVPSHGRDLKRGTLHGIVKSTGLSIEEFIALL